MSNPFIKARHWPLFAYEIHSPIQYTSEDFTLGTMLHITHKKYPNLLFIADNATAEHAIATDLF